MESVKIILDTGQEIEVYGIFYIFNSKYYFMYTAKEFDGEEYVKLYVVQVCKEVKSTPSGSVDTGYMLGMEISDAEEWKNIQFFRFRKSVSTHFSYSHPLLIYIFYHTRTPFAIYFLSFAHV